MNRLFLMASVAATALTATAGNAAVVCTGNCAPFNETIQIVSNNNPSPTVSATTNQSNAPVLFTSNEVAGLLGPSSGAARVEAADGTLNSLTFELIGYTFTSAVWNLNGADANTTLTITYYTPGANVYATSYLLDTNGNNFFGITAGVGEHISKISLALSGGGVDDLRQLRFGGVAKVTSNPPAVPEPATWGLMIAGFAGVGAAMRRKTSIAFA